MKRIILTAISYLAILSPAVATATELTTIKDAPIALIDVSSKMEAMCFDLARKLSANAHFQPAFQHRPSQTSETCRCAIESIRADQKLRRQFDGEDSLIKERLKSAQLESYFLLRTTSAVLSCLSADFEKTLQVIELK